jgi:hypothetical protein
MPLVGFIRKQTIFSQIFYIFKIIESTKSNLSNVFWSQKRLRKQ